MQGARWESGQDDSPMFDCASGAFWHNDDCPDLFDNTTHRMLSYDVGASAYYAASADALAVLASAIGRPADAASLTARADAMRSLMQAHLWDSSRGVFADLFLLNSSISHRISPTSFYALLAHAASDAQADQMISEWAFNASRFCLSATWPQGVDDTCYWGLPSISADDPAYPPLGYWRGFVWGPMHMLTWWSFREYSHLPTVSAARAQLAVQAAATVVNQYRRNRHVCENFSPWRNATDCSGSNFYHWGALGALLPLLEAGF